MFAVESQWLDTNIWKKTSILVQIVLLIHCFLFLVQMYYKTITGLKGDLSGIQEVWSNSEMKI